jgi:hypothetical protein
VDVVHPLDESHTVSDLRKQADSFSHAV